MKSIETSACMEYKILLFLSIFFCKFLNNAPSHPSTSPHLLLPWPQSANPLRAAAALVQHAKIIIISFWLLPRLGFNSFPPPPLLFPYPHPLLYLRLWLCRVIAFDMPRLGLGFHIDGNGNVAKMRRPAAVVDVSVSASLAFPSPPPLAAHPFTGCCYFSGVTIKFRNPFFFALPSPKTYEIKGCNNVLAPLSTPLCHASSLRVQGLLLLLLQTAAAAKHRQPFVVLNFPSLFLFFLWIFINFQ